MAKGVIQTVLGAGRYAIQLDYGSEIKAQKLAVLTARGTELLGEINKKDNEYFAKESQLIPLQQQINVLIDEYASLMQQDSEGDYSQQRNKITELLEEIAQINEELSSIKTQLEELKSEYAQNERNKGAIASVGVTQNYNAWCVDYTTTASGEVATIEVPGENDAVLIAPGCRAHKPEDGILRARGLLDPNQAYFNAAILPGWQRWKPTYRKATITELNKAENRASVLLDDAISSAQQLPVNFDLLIENVPVRYMACNSSVFEVGDRCVVQFDDQDLTKPFVIGFVENPRPCYNLEIFTASVFSVQGYPRRENQQVSDEEYYDLASQGLLIIKSRRRCENFITLPFFRFRFDVATYRDPLEIDHYVDIWPSGTNSIPRTQIIFRTFSDSVNECVIQTPDGRTVAVWSIYHIGGSSYAMDPLYVTPASELPFTPTQNITLWDKNVYPDCP